MHYTYILLKLRYYRKFLYLLRFVIATEDIKPGELIAEENSIIGVAGL